MSATLEGHTLQSYDSELNHVHVKIVEMARLALGQCSNAVQAFEDQDFELANRIIEREHEVDLYELEIDNEIIAVIAKRSPVARDLRVIMSLCKSVTDLERIGDEAAKIAHLTKEIFDNDRADPSIHLLRDVTRMGGLALHILNDAVEALDALDLEKAKTAIKKHIELDIEFQSSLRRLTTFILEDARNVGYSISIVLITKALERVGDHARNIAEYIVFLVDGKDIRHSKLEINKDVHSKRMR